jgi:hypothetical protein
MTFRKSLHLFAALAATGYNNEMDREQWESQGLRSISLLQPVAARAANKCKDLRNVMNQPKKIFYSRLFQNGAPHRKTVCTGECS